MCERQAWQHHEFYAMGSQMTVWLELEDATIAAQVLSQVEALFAIAEKRLSRFCAASELSQLNRHPGEWWPVSNVLWTVVTRAMALAKQTDGRFDPTLLTALTAAGYDRPFPLLAATDPTSDTFHRHQQAGACSATAANCAHRALPHPSSILGQWQQVELDPARHAIRLPMGIQIDLGGLGKGYMAQQAVNFLSHWGPCLVDAGGDLVAGDAPSRLAGWPVAIAAPTADSDDEQARDLAQLWLKNAALATSGTDYRRWQTNGGPAHHLIDPTTGRPTVSDLLTVSVLAADGSTAEAWAKALLLRGFTGAHQEMQEKRIAAALVDHQQVLTVAPALEPFVALRFDA